MTNQVQQKKMDMEHPTLGSYMQIQSSESTTLFSGKKIKVIRVYIFLLAINTIYI
jgi:hypothetical protein